MLNPPDNSTMKSPQILELSGIGDPELLAKIGVELKVNLPAVGTNVQDHPFVALSYGAQVHPFHRTIPHFLIL